MPPAEAFLYPYQITGSSPVSPTIKKPSGYLSGGFFVLQVQLISIWRLQERHPKVANTSHPEWTKSSYLFATIPSISLGESLLNSIMFFPEIAIAWCAIYLPTR
jgi:hypothetical protein